MKYNKELKLRFKYLKKEYSYIFLKYILKKYLKKSIKFSKKFLIVLIYFFFKKQNKFKILKKNIKNYCIITNRSKSIYFNYKISRIQLRKLGSNKDISGFLKKNW